MRRSFLALALALALVSCGGDEEPRQAAPAPAPPPTQTTVRPPAETSSGAPSSEPPPQTATTSSSPPPSGDCGVRGEYRVRVVGGDVPCEEARSTAAGFSPDGPKVQQVGGYTCEGGEADARPLVFTCVVGDKEITASEP